MVYTSGSGGTTNYGLYSAAGINYFNGKGHFDVFPTLQVFWRFL
jgi:hypothetical protein